MRDLRAVRLAQRAAGLAAAAGIDLPDSLALWQLAGRRPDATATPSDDPAGELDQALEASLAQVERRRGAHHTPRRLADRVAGMALGVVVDLSERGSPRGQRRQLETPRVVDPACGGGALLLAAARRLIGEGLPAEQIARDLLWGADISPLAAAVTEAAITLWSGGTPPAPGHVVVADTLADSAKIWSSAPPAGFDVLVGNPPFQAQLGRGTTRSPEQTAALRERFGAVVAPYVDTAALFLLVGAELLRPAGSMAMVLPQSVVASRDAAAVRAALAERASLRELWIPEHLPFGANVQVCVAALRVGSAGRVTSAERRGAAPANRVAVAAGSEPALQSRDEQAAQLASVVGEAPCGAALAAEVGTVDRRGRVEPSTRSAAADWAGLLATARRVPELELSARCGTVGDRATAVAGFRDEYYGLVEHICEAGASAGAPLVTSGSIDVASCSWGERAVRFAKQRWDRPEVDLGSLARSNPKLWAWVDRLRRPKVLVASQTRIIEAAVDESGSWVPVTPTVSVLPNDHAAVWHLAAVLCAPPVSVWAARRVAGTGLSPGAMRVSAPLVLGVPLPVEADAWDAASAAFQRADLVAYAELATAMYGLPAPVATEVRTWWTARLPR